MPTSSSDMKRRSWLTLILAIVILVPAMLGFGNKFREFLILFWGDKQGSFAIVPVLNYLLAASGFLMLFLWAILHGMFRDIEQPKHSMLANEAALDRAEDDQRLQNEYNTSWENGE